MSSARVLVAPKVLQGVGGPYREALETAGLEPVYPDSPAALMEPKALRDYLMEHEIAAVLAGMEPFEDAVISGSPLRVIARMGVGYDAIDVDAATRNRVAVTITPGTNEPSVAEQMLALLFAVMRGIVVRHRREVLTGEWKRRPLPRLAGKTLGLVGLGRIGKAIVRRAIGLELQLIACDPVADEQFAREHGVRMVGFEELLRQSDIVSLHAPATPKTADMINAQTLALMKPGAVLINTARGSLVDEDALAESLRSGHLLGAGLDVFKEEPLPTDSPLLELDSVVLAPHMAGLDHESEVAMSHLAAKCVADLYQGRWPEGCVVNESIRDGWKW